MLELTEDKQKSHFVDLLYVSHLFDEAIDILKKQKLPLFPNLYESLFVELLSKTPDKVRKRIFETQQNYEKISSSDKLYDDKVVFNIVHKILKQQIATSSIMEQAEQDLSVAFKKLNSIGRVNRSDIATLENIVKKIIFSDSINSREMKQEYYNLKKYINKYNNCLYDNKYNMVYKIDHFYTEINNYFQDEYSHNCGVIYFAISNRYIKNFKSTIMKTRGVNAVNRIDAEVVAMNMHLSVTLMRNIKRTDFIGVLTNNNIDVFLVFCKNTTNEFLKAYIDNLYTNIKKFHIEIENTKIDFKTGGLYMSSTSVSVEKIQKEIKDLDNKLQLEKLDNNTVKKI